MNNLESILDEQLFEKRLANIAKDKKKNKSKRMEEWQNLADVEEFAYDKNWK